MRSEAQKNAEKKNQSLTHRIAIRFRIDRSEDSELLEWLRSQVATDAEIPSLIKQIIEERKNR